MKEQYGIFQKADAGCTERDIVVESYPYSPTSSKIFGKYRVEPNRFTLLLVGKDGFVKFRSNKIVAAQSIFNMIDVMPMRREEITRRKNK